MTSIAAWRQQRPDLDVAPLQVLSRVSRLARHLDIARRGAFAAHGLESWEFDVLSALRRAGPPFQLTPGALLRATLVTSGTMTNRIDRLAAAGLVYREPDPRDRRGVLVTLSERGRTVVDAASHRPARPRARPCWPASATTSDRCSPTCSAPSSSPSTPPISRSATGRSSDGDTSAADPAWPWNGLALKSIWRIFLGLRPFILSSRRRSSSIP